MSKQVWDSKRIRELNLVLRQEIRQELLREIREIEL